MRGEQSVGVPVEPPMTRLTPQDLLDLGLAARAAQVPPAVHDMYLLHFPQLVPLDDANRSGVGPGGELQLDQRRTAGERRAC